MIQDFPLWSAPRAEVCPFADLHDTTLAIEADFYLERLITTKPWREPLLSALGGLPFAAESHMRKELGLLRAAGITPVFVFGGLESGQKFEPFEERKAAAAGNARAWELYAQHEPQAAVNGFGNSGYARPEHLHRMLQTILRDEKVEFQVAPYSAWAQLAYLSRQQDRYVDAIAGSSELLLFDIEQFISNINFTDQEFTFVRQQSCLEEIAATNQDMFIDACLLSGNHFLPTIPLLPDRRPQKIKGAMELIKNIQGQSAIAVCLANQEAPQLKQMDYLNRYRRSRLAIKHQVILTSEGKIVVLEQQDAPGDMDVFLGLQLPDELYYYLSIGVVGTRILNQFTSRVMQEVTPIDGGESQAYRNLISDKLTPIRQTTLATLGYSLHKGYHYHPIKLNTWFNPDPEKARIFMVKDEQNPSDAFLRKWNVHETVFPPSLASGDASLAAALHALADSQFAAKSITPRSRSDTNVLKTQREVTLNTLWRFLHLRQYVDDKHNLTPWGRVLSAVLAKLGPTGATESAAVVAVELLRYELLNSDDMFPTYSGGPRGSEVDQRNCLIVSRIACLGRLQHEPIGFTGPLSRHVLGYTSIVNAVNTSLRDLLEATLAAMLLNGDVDRDRSDLTDISLDLPFLLPFDCALGIAMKHYLDELPSTDGPPTPETKAMLMDKGEREWLLNARDVKGDLERMFCLWDAVYAGIQVALEHSLLPTGGSSGAATSGNSAEAWAALDVWVRERR